MVSYFIKFFLLSFSFFTFYSPAILSQMLPPFPSRQGQWQVLQESIGVSAMHMQVLHNNKVVLFDRTNFGSSNITLSGGRCRYDPYEMALREDCSAHSIIYDIPTNTFRTLMVQTDTWCSSGAILPNGTLVQTGGFHEGDHVVRTFTPCLDGMNCDWVEFPNSLSERRWYASNQRLPDGRIIIVGGRRQFNYEFYPDPSRRNFQFRLLRQTRDGSDENNLYPFLHLLPDGNLFIFANTRSVLLDYNRHLVIREFPPIPGDDPRNYPSMGSSVLLPLDENADTTKAEIVICGGAPRGSFRQAEAAGVYVSAISSCGRLTVTDQNPSWIMETMPTPRVMGDMLILPTGDLIIINGAESGTGGWENARNPITTPIIYRPHEHPDWRFAVMAPATRPRMYHSSAVLLPDTRILVGGSNPHVNYSFYGELYPTDLSLEAFSPPYLSAEYAAVKPTIISQISDQTLQYGRTFSVAFQVQEYLSDSVVSVRIVSPSFTTHSFAMNQRMVVLRITSIDKDMYDHGVYRLSCVGPSRPEIAPSGYYMLFIVHSGVPSSAIWVRVQ